MKFSKRGMLWVIPASVALIGCDGSATSIPSPPQPNREGTGGTLDSSSGDGGTSGGGVKSGMGGDASGSSGGTGQPGGASAGASTAGEPYAHVVAVTAAGDEQEYQFSVSVQSSDVDCDHFANWWEVLSVDGTLIYRRILRHSHTDENGTSDPDAPGNTFTRSSDAPIPVSSDQVVLVRAHLFPYGYSGRVMRGSVESGFEVASDIGPDFAAGVETEPPLSDICDF